MDLLSPIIGLAQLVAPALVDGYGVKVKVVRCEPCVDGQFLTDRVHIEPALLQRLQSLIPFSNAVLHSTLTAAQVEEALRELRLSILQAEETFREINLWLSKLESGTEANTAEAKQRFVAELLSSRAPMLLRAVVGGIRYGRELDVPAEPELQQLGDRIAEVLPAPTGSGGFVLRLPSMEFPFSTGRAEDTAKLEPAARALAYFHRPGIRDLLVQAKDRLASLHLDRDAIELLRTQLLSHQPLLVEVFVANGRKLPVALTNEARLFVSGNGWRSEAEIELGRVERTGARARSASAADDPSVIDGGSGKMFLYLSAKRMAALLEELPGFERLDQHRWRIVLRRADSERPEGSWLRRTFRPPLRTPEPRLYA